jgi:small subunit ribosomal protein S6
VSLITYETVFIAEPEIPVDQVDQMVGKIKQTITAHQGSVTGEDRWGRRRLAYPIHGHREGFYVVLNYTADNAVVSEIEHFFNVTDSVIRHLTVRIIKKNKTFRPRRERPAGHAEGFRPGGRPGASSRPRAESAAAPSAKAPAAEPSSPAAGVPEAAPSAPPEGGPKI